LDKMGGPESGPPSQCDHWFSWLIFWELLQVMLVTKNVMLEFVVIVLYKSKALSEGYNNKSGTIIKIVFSPQQIIHKNTTQ